MYIDLWQWFHNNSGIEYHTLRNYSYQGWRYMRAAQIDLAYQTFMEGYQAAKQLRLPCWEIYYEYWACEVLIYRTTNRQKALDKTVRLAARTHEEKYKQCPVLGRIYFILADVYAEIDLYGYEDKVRKALDALESGVPLDIDTHLRAMHVRAYYDFMFERYDEAEKRVQEYVAIAIDENNSHRQTDANKMLRHIEVVRGNFHRALEFSYQAEHHAEKMGYPDGVVEERIWQGILLLLTGKEKVANMKYQAGLGHHAQHQLERKIQWYEANCAYLEFKGIPDQALKLREEQLAHTDLQTSITNETQTHLQYCRLLGRMGKPIDEALKNAKDVTERMIKPDFYLKKLSEIESGKYDEYEWQAKFRGEA